MKPLSCVIVVCVDRFITAERRRPQTGRTSGRKPFLIQAVNGSPARVSGPLPSPQNHRSPNLSDVVSLAENDVEDVTSGIHSLADGPAGASGKQGVGNKSLSAIDDQYSEFVRRKDYTLESPTLHYSASPATENDEIELEDVDDKNLDELKSNGIEDVALTQSLAVDESGLEQKIFVTENDGLSAKSLELEDVK